MMCNELTDFSLFPRSTNKSQLVRLGIIVAGVNRAHFLLFVDEIKEIGTLGLIFRMTIVFFYEK